MAFCIDTERHGHIQHCEQLLLQTDGGDLCKPMTRKYFLQYQWMPFYVAALSILYYLPYIAYMLCNSDIISLKGTLKSGDKVTRVYLQRRLATICFSKLTTHLDQLFIKGIDFFFVSYTCAN